MLFNSLPFLVFFPVVVAAYFLLPHRLRNGWLLVASLYFYATWNPWFLLLVVASTSVDFAMALLMERTTSETTRRRALWIAVGTNLAVLGSFKYGSSLLIPIGLSFHTFQAMGYVIDVYYRRTPAERGFPTYLLFIVFFPQLVAGPIERAATLLPQLRRRHSFDYERLVDGLALMLWGLFKKVVVADRLGVFVDAAYADPGSRSGLGLLFATGLFAFQLYYDFSGYSDVAVGSARVLGFDLTRNFDRPFAASSLGEFWRRWHVSLSRWFHDYVYVPLGRSRVALVVTFLLSGIWHGASWTFPLWGAVHAALMLVARRRGNVVTTFLLVTLAFVLFRAPSVAQAVDIYARMAQAPDPSLFLRELAGMGGLTLALLGIVVAEAGEAWRFRIAPPFRWAAYTALLWTTIVLGNYEAKRFLYFAF